MQVKNDVQLAQTREVVPGVVAADSYNVEADLL